MDTHTLIWLFPIAFMFHDFEEIVFGEPWLKQNAAGLVSRMRNRFPAIFVRQIEAEANASAAELALPVGLIFALACLASYLAAERGVYGLFFLAAGLFFMHGFMHIGQAVLFRGYVPAVITSVLFVLPYGFILFGRLLQENLLDPGTLAVCFVLSVPLTIPFILVMLQVGRFLYAKSVKLLIG